MKSASTSASPTTLPCSATMFLASAGTLSRIRVAIRCRKPARSMVGRASQVFCAALAAAKASASASGKVSGISDRTASVAG